MYDAVTNAVSSTSVRLPSTMSSMIACISSLVSFSLSIFLRMNDTDLGRAAGSTSTTSSGMHFIASQASR